jgi:hypothetical protein
LEKIPLEQRIYVDESGIQQDLIRTHGKAKSGVRIKNVRRRRKFQRTNVVGALCSKDMLAHFCYAQTMTGDGEFFEQWFKKSLLNTVKKGCTIIMNNAFFHRKKKLEKIATEGQIKLLFLPPYSPDFNSIEKCKANLKHTLVDLLPDFSDVASAVYSYYKYDTC